MNDSMPDERRYKFLTISIPPPEDSKDQNSHPVALDIRNKTDGSLLLELRFMENVVSIRTRENGEIKYLGTYLRDEGRISPPDRRILTANTSRAHTGDHRG